MTLDYVTLSDWIQIHLIFLHQKLSHKDSKVSEGEGDYWREAMFHTKKLPISNIHKIFVWNPSS